MGIEFELKYRATVQQLAAIREAFAGETQTITMETAYYDTPAGDLSARRYTLRRRLANGHSVCTLKTPAGCLGRGEWEENCDTITDGVKALCKLDVPADLAALTADGLVQVCGARFQRTAKLLQLHGCTAELALDTGVLLGGGREAPLCEVEVELKSGSREAALQFGGQLAEKYGLVPEEKSKFRRALALARGE